MPEILFVCTANRYRSPIAAACFKHELDVRGAGSGWEVLSAGTWATEGLPPMLAATLEAEKIGLDIKSNRSRTVTIEMLRAADLVLVMERGQKEALQIEFHDYQQKVELLREVTVGIPSDIRDPVGDSTNHAVGAEICGLIHGGFDKICARAVKNSGGN
jgi:protein arginine phosphatase